MYDPTTKLVTITGNRGTVQFDTRLSPATIDLMGKAVETNEDVREDLILAIQQGQELTRPVGWNPDQAVTTILAAYNVIPEPEPSHGEPLTLRVETVIIEQTDDAPTIGARWTISNWGLLPKLVDETITYLNRVRPDYEHHDDVMLWANAMLSRYERATIVEHDDQPDGSIVFQVERAMAHITATTVGGRLVEFTVPAYRSGVYFNVLGDPNAVWEIEDGPRTTTYIPVRHIVRANKGLRTVRSTTL